MSNEYTPSMDRIADLFSWAVAWDASTHDDRPDLAALQVRQRAEFTRALAAHDREAATKALKQAGTELPGWMPGRDRVSEWLWTRAAALGTPEQEEERNEGL